MDEKIHLTLTGPYAGLSYCGIAIVDRVENEKYVHAPYAPYEKWAFKESLCPECKKLFLECLNDGWCDEWAN